MTEIKVHSKTRVAQFTSILPEFAKASIFSILLCFQYIKIGERRKTHGLGRFAPDILGILLRFYGPKN